ncbi:MAG: hypothetical protein JWM53_7050, partial [bacterium]|nr:hypothetical protein [bacterium]
MLSSGIVRACLLVVAVAAAGC